MRPTLRLLPLPFAITFALPAWAQFEREILPDYSLCPVEDAVPAFDDAPTGINLKPVERRSQPTEIEGDSQSGTFEMPVMEGNVALRRGDQFLGTDKLTYDSQAGTYVAEGHVRFQDKGLRIVAERASGDQNEDSHQIDNLRYQLLEQHGNGTAERIEINGENGSMQKATYSTCPPNSPHWRVLADRIDVDSEEGFAVARHATFRLGNVPILYVPWFKFPVDERRRTGLLFPSVSNSSRNGFDYRQPIYFNLAPNYDLTLTPRLMTDRGLATNAEFRYLNGSGAGTVRGMWMPDDKLRDRDRGMFGYTAYQNINRHWRATANLHWLSDLRYVEDFNNSTQSISSTSISSSLALRGRGRDWNAGISVDRWQLTDYTLDERTLPYDRLPRLWGSWENPRNTLVRTGIEADLIRFQHSSWRQRDADYNPVGASIAIPGGTRFDMKPWISLPLSGTSWFFEPKLAWRYTAYHLDEALANQLGQKSPHRSLPIFSMDAGLQLEREFNFRDNTFIQTLEPRLFYLRVPYRDQDHLPRFDTARTTFGWGQLFRDNRYSGADRQSDANQITTALTTRILRERDGFERMNASIGQIHYFDDIWVGGSNGQPAITKGHSAWVADANFSPGDRWQIGASYQWDPNARRKDLVSLRGRYLLGDDGIVNLAYRYRRDILEQADLSFLYPINPTWSVVGRYYYSLKDHKVFERIAGVQWDSCCIAVRLIGREYIRDRAGDLNTSIMLEVEFKGLGSAGQDARGALRRAILGYHRDDLYLVPPASLSDGSTTTPPESTDSTP